MRYACLPSIFALVVGCGATIPVGDDGEVKDKPEDSPETDKDSLDPTVVGSPHYKRCALACQTPKDGPCAGESVNACIEKCTVALEGANHACAQCVVERSGYAGVKCAKIGEPGYPTRFSPGSKALPSKSCEGDGCEEPPICTENDESCEGFRLASLSASSCASVCGDTSVEAPGEEPPAKPTTNDAEAACEHMKGVCAEFNADCSTANADYERLSASEKAQADAQLECIMDANDCDEIAACVGD